MGKPRRRIVGVMQIIGSAIGYGLIGVLGKRAFEAGASAGELLALRFLLAALILWTYVLLTRRHILKMSARQILACAALGVCGYAVFSTLYFNALEGLTASLTVLLLYTYPVIVTLGARLFLKERVTRSQLLALPVVIAGLALLLWGNIRVEKWGAVALALLSAIFYAGYILASSRVLLRVNPLAAGLYIITAGTLALLLWSPRALPRAFELNSEAWMSIIGLALFSTVAPMILFLMGLEKLTSTESSLLSTVEPLTATIAAMLLLGEKLSLVQAAGGLLVLAALVVSTLSRRARNLSEELPHRSVH